MKICNSLILKKFYLVKKFCLKISDSKELGHFSSCQFFREEGNENIVGWNNTRKTHKQNTGSLCLRGGNKQSIGKSNSVMIIYIASQTLHPVNKDDSKSQIQCWTRTWASLLSLGGRFGLGWDKGVIGLDPSNSACSIPIMF